MFRGRIFAVARSKAPKGAQSLAKIAACAVLATAVMVTSAPDATAAGSKDGLFGTREIRSTNLKLFPKWSGTLDRYFQEKQLADRSCEDSRLNRCHLRKWNGFLKRIAGKPRHEQLSAVNAEMNRKRYIIDPVNYGMSDYWATPRQFLRRHGDCEDYAIAKFMSLRALGFSNDSMRIVVVRDLNLRAAHAILVVTLDGVDYVLDNQVKPVVRASAVRHYAPVYSVNESSWWLHRRG